ncbi:carbohydrate ABC transporter permease [Fictibacillus terranigra]|uniref:Sugar ABC transporter permease n=1 Tax=Fictibacillus terranigra TaxID=3058424 RepID=A0ABT8EDJ4_9BACL|nr:sugar ABC transporter permease [Fictibacillus sp. CENA-BCM004]MDN4075993.1 sugar ABC transporter permease [Fictibacillus sp. CENA-BCM004]
MQTEARIRIQSVKKLPLFKMTDRKWAVVFLTPGFILMLIAYVYPLLYSLYLSFSSWDIFNPDGKIKLQGMHNYYKIFTNDALLSSLVRTSIFSFSALVIQLVIGVSVALLVTSEHLNQKFTSLVRAFLLAPMIISPVVAGILWRTLYNREYGPINYFLSLVGISKNPWIADPDTALMSVIIVEIWLFTPFVIFIITGGLLSLAKEPFEAAKVDGATPWQMFWKVTLPLLRPVILIIITLRIMDLFKTFDYVYSMTYGGPGESTEILTLSIYKQGIKFLDVTGAAAASWVLLLILLPPSLYLLRKTFIREGR